VLDGEQARLYVVSALTATGPSLFAVEAGAPGLQVERVATVDISRRVTRLLLEGAPATLITTAGQADAAVRRTRDVGLVLLAAEQVGVTQRCLEMATSWAKEREQFGRAIGSFQAIKHKLATVRLELEAAVSAAMYALWAAQNRPAELSAVARIAAHTCGEAALLAARENIQVHGGIGATWEHPAHVYLRRATLDRRLLGDPQALLEELAQFVDKTVSVSTSVGV
jgi:alkylation response protein AidB-like acyl-CoA dehydrogenase